MPCSRPARFARFAPALLFVAGALLVALAGPATARAPGPVERVFMPLEIFADTLAKNSSVAAAHIYADSIAREAVVRGDRATQVAALLYRAKRYATHEGLLEEAEPYFARALPLARALRDTFALALYHYERGYGLQLAGRNRESMADLTLGVRFARRARNTMLEGNCHRHLGQMAKIEGRYEVARRELEAALRQLPEESFYHLHTRLLFAEVLNRVGLADEARERFEGVLAEAWKRRNRFMIAAAMHDLANVAFEQGDMAEADRQWMQAAAHYDTLRLRGRVDASSAIQARVNRAHALITLGRFDEARALLAAQAERSKEVPDPAIRTSVRAEIGVLERRAGRSEAAENILRSVIASSADGGQAMDEESSTLELVGLLRETGRLGEASSLLDSLLVPERRARMTNVNVAAAHSERSEILRALGRPAEALVAAREGERRTRVVHSKPSIYWFDASTELARAQRANGRPDSAVATLARTARAWEKWRAQISNFEWRERMGSGLSGLFTEYGLALLDPRRGGTEARRAREAFDALQVFQARTLEERMQGKGLSGRAMARRVSADSLRRAVLRPGEALLDLVATPETTFAFVVTPTGTTVRLLAGTRRLNALYGDWRGAMLDGATAAVVERGLGRLSNELLGPLAAPLGGARRLIVSGGGPVMLWPIGALTLPGETAALGATREVTAVPSATLFALLRARSRSPAPARGRLLALGRTTDAAGRDLPGAEREISLLGRAYVGVTVRQNRGEQTVAALTADLGRFDALHLAAHAEATAGTPWRSGFLLGKGTGDDAYFRASSVARMRLTARLAVLSGCQSAGATALSGEGALGLTSGFLCAGTTTVLATLWPVTDTTAERYMAAFYGALATGRSAAAAAREAGAALRSSPGTANPRDWAAFVVVGEPGTTFPLKLRGRA